MLRWTLVPMVVAIIAGVFGFAGSMLAGAGIANLLFYLFVGFLSVSLVPDLVNRA